MVFRRSVRKRVNDRETRGNATPRALAALVAAAGLSLALSVGAVAQPAPTVPALLPVADLVASDAAASSTTLTAGAGVAIADPALGMPQMDILAASPPDWLRYSVPVSVAHGQAMLAIVIDDVGIDRRATQRAIALPGPITLSFISYAHDLPAQTAQARAAGHELLVHLPMEPLGPSVDPGPNALMVGDDSGELHRRMAWALDRFDGYVGINNHMGSRFTADRTAMTVVLSEVGRRGLLYVDSRTIPNTVAPELAATLGVPFAERNVFLDVEPTERSIAAALAAAQQIAREQGSAVAIGHPYPSTLSVLEAWLPRFAEDGIALVPISTIVRHRQVELLTASGGR